MKNKATRHSQSNVITMYALPCYCTSETHWLISINHTTVGYSKPQASTGHKQSPVSLIGSIIRTGE